MSESLEQEDRLQVSGPEVEEINLLDVLIVLASRKRMILRVTAGVTLLAIIISLLLPKKFTACTRILPPQQAQSSSAMMLAQLNPLAAGLGRDLGLKNPSDVYVTMLKSRSVQDALVDKFDLRREYRCNTYADARETLDSHSDIMTGRDGTISVSVEDRNPRRAADLANSYVAELYQLTEKLAITEASQRRLFFEKQLRSAKDDLELAEAALRQTQEKTGLIQLDGQAKVIIESTATLKAQIVTREIQLERVRLFATEQNPEYQALMHELSGLRAQLIKAEQAESVGNGDTQIATAKLPQAALEYVRHFREVKYHEAIFELLSKQYEAARLDEAKNAPIIQVMDPAIVPEKKSSPKRAFIAVVAFVVAFFLSCAWAVFAKFFEDLRSDPDARARLQELRKYLMIGDSAGNA